ncbi:MAG TPA: peptidylprolyl isomerase [Thermoanaerobaculia bacterium]|nr:peptidylprolyl isomerase [Thermoanaerobaculia bacterium]
MRTKDLITGILVIALAFGIAYGIDAMRPALPLPQSQAFRVREGNDTVIMRVNGEPVTEREFALFLSELPPRTQSLYTSEAGKRELADHLVRLKVLEQEARRLGAESDPEVNTRLVYDRSNILADFAIRKIAGSPREADLRAQYDKRKASFETVDLSHILIGYDGAAMGPKSGSRTREEAERRAGEIAGRIARGEPFAELAASESDDSSSAPRGGRLGPVPPESLPPEIRRAVDALAPGKVSAPVTTQFGVHIFRVEGRTTRKFDEVREPLTQMVQRETIERELTRLQNAAKVDLDPGFFGKKKGS